MTTDDARAARLRTAAREAAELAEELKRSYDQMVEASAASNADDEHDPEGATIAWEREQLTTTLASTERTRQDAERALADLEAGTYGTCESCGEAIDPARLDARPGARTCIDCARKQSRR